MFSVESLEREGKNKTKATGNAISLSWREREMRFACAPELQNRRNTAIIVIIILLIFFSRYPVSDICPKTQKPFGLWLE